MKKLLSIFLLSFLSIVFINGCSSSLPEVNKVAEVEESIYENDVRINVKQIFSWVNRMPGSKPRFHISGELKVLEDSKYNINNIIIKKIKIVQFNNVVYNFTPKVESKFNDETKTIIFSTIRGLLVSAMLDSKKNINVEILLSDSANEILLKIPSISIEEAH